VAAFHPAAVYSSVGPQTQWPRENATGALSGLDGGITMACTTLVVGLGNLFILTFHH